MSNAFTESNLVTAMAGRRALISSLMGGTTAMVAAGKAWLPQEVGEENASYNARLARGFLFNKFKLAVKAVSGKLFSKPIAYSDHEPIAPWIEDCDRSGMHLDRFLRDIVMKDSAAFGVSFVLVDSNATVGERTRADDIALGIRPYLVHVPATNLIGWRFDDAGQLIMARIKEKKAIPDGEFGDRLVEQVRVLEPTRTRVFQRDVPPKGSTEAGEIKLVEDYPNETGAVNLIPYYGGGEILSPFVASSLFDDLADANLRHYQSTSEQINILRFARIPILLRRQQQSAAGYDENGQEISGDDEMVIGAGSAVDMGLQDTLTWVEHTGSSTGSGLEDLKYLEDQMDKLSYSLTVRETSGDVTATETSVMAAEAHAVLQALAGSVEDATEQVLRAMARFAGETVEPTVIINKDFGATQVSSDMPLVRQYHEDGIITAEQYLNEGRRRGLIESDESSDKLIAAAQKEKADAAPVVEVDPVVPADDAE